MATFSLRARRKGFTLIEVLISMAILVILIVMFAQVITGMSSAWQSAQQRMDNYTKARAVLSRIQVDINAMVARPDLAAFPTTHGDEFGFFTLRKGSSSGSNANQTNIRNLSYIDYVFKTAADSTSGVKLPGALVRSDESYTLADNLSKYFPKASLPSTSAVATPTPIPTPPPPVPQSSLVMADGVLAFEWAFLRADGTYSPTFYYSDKSNAVHSAIGVAVALLVIDDRSANILGESKLNNLLNDLHIGPPSADGEWSPRKTWEQRLGMRPGQSGGGSVVGKYPARFIQSVRAFERVYVFPATIL